MSTGAVDEARLEQFMGRMIGHMTRGRLLQHLAGRRTRALPRAGRHRAAERRRGSRQGRVQRPAGAGVARRPGGRRAGRLRPGRRHLRVEPRGGDGAGRRRLARFRGPGDERPRLDVPGHAEGGRGLPGQRGAGLGRAPPVPVLRDRVVLPHRLPGLPDHAVDPGARRGRGEARAGAGWPTSAAVTGRPSWRWPTRTRTRRSAGSTSTPRRSRRRASGRPRRASAERATVRGGERERATPGSST